MMVFNRRLVRGFEGDFKFWWITQIFDLLSSKRSTMFAKGFQPKTV